MGALTSEALGYCRSRGLDDLCTVPACPGTKRSYKSLRYNGRRRWGMSSDPMGIDFDFRRWPDAGGGIGCFQPEPVYG